jgi:hypothetical protein
LPDRPPQIIAFTYRFSDLVPHSHAEQLIAWPTQLPSHPEQKCLSRMASVTRHATPEGAAVPALRPFSHA